MKKAKTEKQKQKASSKPSNKEDMAEDEPNPANLSLIPTNPSLIALETEKLLS